MERVLPSLWEMSPIMIVSQNKMNATKSHFFKKTNGLQIFQLQPGILYKLKVFSWDFVFNSIVTPIFKTSRRTCQMAVYGQGRKPPVYAARKNRQIKLHSVPFLLCNNRTIGLLDLKGTPNGGWIMSLV
jgi:hypothetical protein